VPAPPRPPLTEFVTRHDRRLRSLCRAGFALAVVTVTVLSLLPGDGLPRLGPWDKLAHITAYAAIALLGRLGYPARAAMLPLLAAVVALGGALELGQDHVPGRSADLADFWVNCAGALAGALLARAARRVWPPVTAP
jgi:VanZ family protein